MFNILYTHREIFSFFPFVFLGFLSSVGMVLCQWSCSGNAFTALKDPQGGSGHSAGCSGD